MFEVSPQSERNAFRECTLLIPVLNEAGNIGDLLQWLSNLYPEVSVIVLDDESTDGTQAVVKNAARDCTTISIQLLERTNAPIKGITASVLDGLTRVKTPYFIVMDGDLQHPPAVVSRIVSSLVAGDDLCIATRLPYKENQGFHRIFVTRVATSFARYRLFARGYRIKDPMSGFFGGRTELFQSAIAQHGEVFEPGGYKVLFDFLQTLPEDIKISQPTYQFALREEGASKLRPIHAFYFLRSLSSSFFRQRKNS